MGTFATLKGFEKCPKCEAQQNGSQKVYGLLIKREIWIGHEHNIKLDGNMNGKLIESTEEGYQN